MKTTRFEFNVGVNPGYHHKNERLKSPDHVWTFGELWQSALELVFASTDIGVSGVIAQSVTAYRRDWGCPPGGEQTYIVSGLRNPEFCLDDEAWRAAVRMVTRMVAQELGQHTAYLSFSDVDLEYMKFINERLPT